MTEKKAREQPLEVLTKTPKPMRENEKRQYYVIQKIQMIVQNEGLVSQTIMNFPYPIAVFSQDGTLVFVNNVLSEETGLCIADLFRSDHSILNRITDSNYRILDAVEEVFLRKTTVLDGLSDLLAMFISEKSSKMIPVSKYQRAIFFPIIEDADQITLGMALFMK